MTETLELLAQRLNRVEQLRGKLYLVALPYEPGRPEECPCGGASMSFALTLRDAARHASHHPWFEQRWKQVIEEIEIAEAQEYD